MDPLKTIHVVAAIIRNADGLLHADARWLAKEDLDSVQWLPADLDVIQKLGAQEFEN